MWLARSTVDRRRIAGFFRDYTRRVVQHGGRTKAEHWIIHGAGHTSHGGSPAGSHADPVGPNAAVEILRFFPEHAL
jgi:hypothetical protein